MNGIIGEKPKKNAPYRAIKGMTEITSKLSYNGFSVKKASDVLSLSDDVLLSMMQGLFGVDQILVGDDNYWSQDTEAIVVCKLPSKEELSYKLDAELGKTFVSLLDGDLIQIGSFVNDTNRTYDYDAISYDSIVEFNAGAKKILQVESA